MLTSEEKQLFAVLISGKYKNFSLLEGTFNGTRAVFIVCLNMEDKDKPLDAATEEDNYLITPLAVLLRDEDMSSCGDWNNNPLESSGGKPIN